MLNLDVLLISQNVNVGGVNPPCRLPNKARPQFWDTLVRYVVSSECHIYGVTVVHRHYKHGIRCVSF